MGLEFRQACAKIISGILTVIVTAILAIIFVFGFVKAHNVKYNVTDAALTVFNYTSGNNTVLQYDLALNVTVRNPNKHIKFTYDHIEASLLYQGSRLDTYVFDPFKQGHKTTCVLSHQFKGQQLVPLNAEQKNKLQMETSSRVYSIDVMIFLKIHSEYVGHEDKYKEKVTCALHVPLISGGAGGRGGSSGFEITKCKTRDS